VLFLDDAKTERAKERLCWQGDMLAILVWECCPFEVDPQCKLLNNKKEIHDQLTTVSSSAISLLSHDMSPDSNYTLTHKKTSRFAFRGNFYSEIYFIIIIIIIIIIIKMNRNQSQLENL